MKTITAILQDSDVFGQLVSYAETRQEETFITHGGCPAAGEILRTYLTPTKSLATEVSKKPHSELPRI